IFQRIGERKKSVEDFKENEDTDALNRLCNALAAHGFLIKEGNEFRNSESSKVFLTDNSEHDLRPMIQLLHRAYETWDDLEKAIEQGQSYEKRDNNNIQDWDPDFIAAMEARAYMSAPAVADNLSSLVKGGDIIDLGGGSGAFCRAILKKDEEAKGVVGDLSHVVKEAQKFADQHQMTGCMEFKELDLLNDEDYGSGYDLALLSAIVHCFGHEENQKIVNRAYSSLNDGGTVAILDYIMNEDKTEPIAGPLFSLNMLLSTETGDVYSFSEIEEWMKEAGFKNIRRIELEEAADLVLGEK
ncbi:MAG: methyltransferase, partial [Flavobacteriales bacterium]